MTEKQDREISLNELARKFAGGDKASRGEWLKTLRQAVTDGRLESREKRVSSGGVARRLQTVGHTTIAGMPARVVAPTGRQALYESLSYVYLYVTPAAVAAWLATLPDDARKDIRSQGWAWLGTEWPVKGSEAPSLTAWEGMSPEEKRAAWLAMTTHGRREKARELLAKHGGNKTAAGAEVGISGNGLRYFLKDAEPEKSEAALPVNPYTVVLGLVKPKRSKASG